jgi:HEAT repeat protein
MISNRLLPCALSLSAMLAVDAPAQGGTKPDWTDDQLVQFVPGFQDREHLPVRLQQVGKLLQHQKEAFAAIVARIHGDHREYLLKVDRLLDELADDRWQVREEAERTLVEIGGRAQAVIRQRVENYKVLEESIRCKRILEAITNKGTEQEDRETAILVGLVVTALYMDPDPRLLRALRSSTGHTEPLVVDGTIRALGAHGGDDEADAVFQMLQWKGGVYRQTTLAALARMPAPRALALCKQLIDGNSLDRAELCSLLRVLRQRTDAGQLIQALADHRDRVVAAAARLPWPATAGDGPKVRLTLSNREPLEGRLLAFGGNYAAVADAIAGLPRAEIAFADCDILDFPEHPIRPTDKVRVFLSQGSLVTGDLLGMDPEAVRLRSSVFGDLTIPRGEIQGIAVDPQLDRLVGASVEHDRVRLRSNEFLDGRIESVAGGKVDVALLDGSRRQVGLDQVAGLLTIRPRSMEPDATVYARVDLTNGDRVIGFLVGSSASHLGLAAPLLGAAVVPITAVAHVEVGVGGGAMWGFTLIADYSDNRIIEVDDQGRVVFQVDDVFGAWDAECLDNGNLLITEFSVSRVQEVDRKGKQVWVFEDLKNPYDADRLPNGNTLIADTFGSRVIEVAPDGKIVWKYDQEIRPFDCDRLQNGNTLIADVLKDRVIEVSPAGEVVWEAKNMNNVHDADRLPNGNTLITLRSKCAVIEVDRDGKVVWELPNLSSPSDADRLPNGHTVVAENTQVREFDRRGNVVWRKEMTWAVEVNRY